ncbi:MAG: mechanosensitive ion channel family protein [Actinomycetota bacterium]|nr:mechanosensitive ion channel family protein [Actinomycetota bacterium]
MPVHHRRATSRAPRAPRLHRHRAVAALTVLLLVVIGGAAVIGGVAAAQPAPETTSTTEAPTTTSSASTTAVPTTAGPSTTVAGVSPGPTTTVAPADPTGGGGAGGATPSTVAPSSGAPSAPSDTVAPAVDDQQGVTTTLPSGPPEGFTDDQFRTFVSVVQACGGEPGPVCRQVLAWTGNRTVAEAAQWIASVPLAVATVLLVALAANWLVRRGIRRYLRRLEARSARHVGADGPSRLVAERRALRMATISSTLGSAASVVIFVAAVFVALAQLDISLGPLLAGAGIVGAALGFGAQNIVRDFLAGLFVTIEDQYGVGDIIDVGRASGVVEGITLRMTKLRDVEGTLWFVPNGEVKEVGNMTQRWSRVILDIAVAYGSDHHEAGRLIKEAADAMWRDPDSPARLLEEPELWGVESLGEASVVIRVAVKSYPADQWVAARELRSRIKDSFDAAGIEFPIIQPALWARQTRETADA